MAKNNMLVMKDSILGMSVLALLLFGALSLLLFYDPAIAAAPDPSKLEKYSGGWWAEDSYIESFTALFAFVAGLAWIYAIRKARNEGIFLKGFEYAIPVTLVVVMVVLAGEEVSWGQRFFGIETPEYLAAVNKQKEINLHNVNFKLTDGPLNIIILSYIATLSWGIVCPLLQRYSNGINRLFWFFRAPVPPISCIPFFVIAPVFRYAYFPGYGNFAREGMELLFGIAFILVALYAAVRPSSVWVRPRGQV